jgi:hypothetical protein
LPISFSGKPKEEDVVSLIAAKKYARAIEVLKAQLRRRGANPTLRMQLADVLILADKRKEAVALLLPLADQYATDGFAAKAVSVLKKVQKIEPGRRDVDERIARLIEEKQREAVVPPTLAPSIGIEEPLDDSGAAATDGPGLEIGLGAIAPISAPADTPPFSPAPSSPAPPALAPMPPPVPPAPPTPGPRAERAVPALPPAAPPPPPSPIPPPPAIPAPPPPVVAPPPPPAATPPPPHAAPAAPSAPPAPSAPAVPPAPASVVSAEIEDYDLLYTADEDEEDEIVLEAVPVEEAEADAEPMSATQFADELMGLVDSVFQEFPSTVPTATAASREAPAPGRQIVVSPLFRDFSVDEMVAVIEGLRLLAFERGDVILKEGQPGVSLYMLTSGRVRAFRKNPESGRQDVLGDLKEGAFFGEGSILTGRPRTASIVALTRCELLELDRPTLDEITKTHPRVWDVMREFARQRAS